MLNIKLEKKESKVLVKISLQKRVLSREQKIFLKKKDVLEKVKKEFPDLKLEEVRDLDLEINNLNQSHEIEWEFFIKKNHSKINSFNNKKKKEKLTKSETTKENVLTDGEDSANLGEAVEGSPLAVQEQTE